MGERKRISPRVRRMVYEKYGGHCAYCGCELTMHDMQVDHLKSVYESQDWAWGHDAMSTEELNSIDNLMPACRACNFYKGTMTLENFRETLVGTLLPNIRKTFQFRLAEKYGMVSAHEKPVEFYFERKDKPWLKKE